MRLRRPSLSRAAAVAGLAALLVLAGCATPPASAAASDAGTQGTAPAKPACEPDPFCYQSCLRGYQPGYCRFHCGC
jgi:hypothetical protein